MKLQTGIYRHFKGDLYFVERLVTNAQTDRPMVVYHALYPRHPGEETAFCREFSDFKIMIPDGQNNTVQRFSLINVISPKKMPMFLPGSRVIDKISSTEYRVVEWKNGNSLSVSLESAHSKTEQVLIDFLTHFELAE